MTATSCEPVVETEGTMLREAVPAVWLNATPKHNARNTASVTLQELLQGHSKEGTHRILWEDRCLCNRQMKHHLIGKRLPASEGSHTPTPILISQTE